MEDEKFEELMQKPYRAWIDHYHRIMDLPEMERELDGIIGELPDGVYDGMTAFMDAAMRFLVSEPKSWNLPGTEIAALIALMADEKIPAVQEGFRGEEKDNLYGALFDIVTLFFSARACESGELRQIIGLEK
jgi:hypothetical protein